MKLPTRFALSSKGHKWTKSALLNVSFIDRLKIMSFRLLTNSTLRICRNLPYDIALPKTVTANIVVVGYPRYFHVGRTCNRDSTGYVDADYAVEDVAEKKRKQQVDVDFGDFKRAYGSHSIWSIAKALVIFRMCSFSWLLDNSSQVGDFCILYVSESIRSSNAICR